MTNFKKHFLLLTILGILSIDNWNSKKATIAIPPPDITQQEITAFLKECEGLDVNQYNRCALRLAGRISPNISPLWKDIQDDSDKEQKKLVDGLGKVDWTSHPESFETWKNGKNLNQYPALQSYVIRYRVLQKLQDEFKQKNSGSCLWTEISYLDEGCEQFCRSDEGNLQGYLCLNKDQWKQKSKEWKDKRGSLVKSNDDSDLIFRECEEHWPEGIEESYVPNWDVLQNLYAKKTQFTLEEKEDLEELFRRALKPGKISTAAGMYKVIKLMQIKSQYEAQLDEPLTFKDMPKSCTPYSAVFSLSSFQAPSTLQTKKAEQFRTTRMDYLFRMANDAKQESDRLFSKTFSMEGPDEKEVDKLKHKLTLEPILYGGYHSTEPFLKGIHQAFLLASKDDAQLEQQIGWFMARYLLRETADEGRKRVIERGMEELKKQYGMVFDAICNPEPTGLYRLEYLVGDEAVAQNLVGFIPQVEPLHQCLQEKYVSRSDRPKEIASIAKIVTGLSSMVFRGAGPVATGMQWVDKYFSDEERRECFSAVGMQNCPKALQKKLSEKGILPDLADVVGSSVSSMGPGGGGFGAPRPPSSPRPGYSSVDRHRMDIALELLEREYLLLPSAHPTQNMARLALNGRLNPITHAAGSVRPGAISRIIVDRLEDEAAASNLIHRGLLGVIRHTGYTYGRTRIVQIKLPESVTAEQRTRWAENIATIATSGGHSPDIANLTGPEYRSAAGILNRLEEIIKQETKGVGLGTNRHVVGSRYDYMYDSNPLVIILHKTENQEPGVLGRVIDMARDLRFRWRFVFI